MSGSELDAAERRRNWRENRRWVWRLARGGPARDRVAWWIANAALRWLATERYEKMIAGLIIYGRQAVDREVRGALDGGARSAEGRGDKSDGGGGDAAAEGDGAAASASGEP